MVGGSSTSHVMFTLVNFICIMILYGVVLYTFGKYIDVEDEIQELRDYKDVNERQLRNLVKDINYNDRYISAVLETHQHGLNQYAKVDSSEQ